MEKTKDASKKHLFILSLAALGVVFGDIGTSPLYAVRECFYGDYGIAATSANIMGAISLIFWALIIVISFKYLTIVLRADNDGEGGILALMELVIPKRKKTKRRVILIMGLFGAALLYGDGMITPAISVLSATEGLKIATPFFEPFIVPITVVILIGLFAFQKRGTQGIGMIFGPLILIWFLSLAGLGISSIIKTPEILEAVNPYYAVQFFQINRLHGIFILGAVFLVVTGGEALYADIGHFGKLPIRWSWFTIVLPCLLLNYFGQGALLLRSPEYIVNPFYHLVPDWAIYPMVILATIATIIASQAIITGAFSLTYQALQLGFLPRVKVVHTSAKEEGQIYMPHVNWIIFLGTITLVLSFQSSSKLAAAYGIAVTTTMVITSLLTFIAMKDLWKWKMKYAIPLTIFFLAIDSAFLYANIDKIPDGGWIPIIIAIGIYFVMTTWSKGRRILNVQLNKIMEPLACFIKRVLKDTPSEVPGIAIYLTSSPERTPHALIKNLEHNKIVHKKIFILSVKYKSRPHVAKENRLQINHIKERFYKITVNYGYMDRNNIPEAIGLLSSRHDFKFSDKEINYFLGRETIIVNGKMGMPVWREIIFVWLSRNSQRATRYFNLPPGQVFEVGSNIVL